MMLICKRFIHLTAIYTSHPFFNLYMDPNDE